MFCNEYCLQLLPEKLVPSCMPSTCKALAFAQRSLSEGTSARSKISQYDPPFANIYWGTFYSQLQWLAYG